MAKMKISVIIATLNRKEDLCNTIEGYKKQTYRDVEIIILDNGSTDGTREEIPKRFPDVRYYWFPQNIETVAINYGMSIANGDIFWLSNNDSYPESEYAFEEVVRIFTTYPEIHILATEDFEVRENAVYNWYRKPVSREKMPETGYEASLFHGTGVGIRRQVYERIGGFWELFVYEELDYCIRAKKAGFTIRYFPTIRTLHFASRKSRNREFRWQRAYLHTLRILWKYFPYPIAFLRSGVASLFYLLAGIRNRIPVAGFFETYLEALPLIIRTVRKERDPIAVRHIREWELSIATFRDYFSYVTERYKIAKNLREG